jgi:hypothetical protein
MKLVACSCLTTGCFSLHSDERPWMSYSVMKLVATDVYFRLVAVDDYFICCKDLPE